MRSRTWYQYPTSLGLGPKNPSPTTSQTRKACLFILWSKLNHLHCLGQGKNLSEQSHLGSSISSGCVGQTLSIGCTLLLAPVDGSLMKISCYRLYLLLILFLWVDSTPSTARHQQEQKRRTLFHVSLAEQMATFCVSWRALRTNDSTSRLLKSFQSADELWWNGQPMKNSPPQPCNQVAYGLYNNRSGRSEVPTASINGRSRRMGYGRMGSSNVASCKVKQSSLKPHESSNKMKQIKLSARAGKIHKNDIQFHKIFNSKHLL